MRLGRKQFHQVVLPSDGPDSKMMQSVARASARASASCRIVVVSRPTPARALCDAAMSSAAGRSLPLASGTLARRRNFSSALALDGEETGGEHTRQAAADTEAKPRPRRRLLRERPAPITLVGAAVCVFEVVFWRDGLAGEAASSAALRLSTGNLRGVRRKRWVAAFLLRCVGFGAAALCCVC